MGDILMKILGFIIGAGIILGLIGFIIMLIQFAWAAANGKASVYLPWLPWLGSGSYTIKGKITINNDEDVQHQDSIKFDPMKQPMRIAPRPKPKKPKKQKPEWWHFLTEESIGSLIEKRRKKKAEADVRKNDPWQNSNFSGK